MATMTIENNNEAAVLSKIKNVAGLLRISTEKTDNLGKKVNLEKTLKNHKEKMLHFLAEKKWEAELFEEVVSGGKNVEDRPELKRLIENIQKFDAIVVMELVRLSRQGLSSQIIKEEVKKKGILIITMNPFKIYDLQIPQDAFLYDLSISMGEYERMLTSLRIKQNKISMAHQGLNSSGSVPYGYIRNPKTKKLEIERMEKDGVMVESPKAEIVRQVFKWYIEGDGHRTICDKLNSMGVKNNMGNSWVPNSIKTMLKRKTYKGTLVANNFENVKGKMIATETIEKENNHPAIIEPDIWEQAQQLREIKNKRSGANERDTTSKENMSILDGLVYCACKGCNRKSNIKWYKGRQKHYITKCVRFNTNGIECTNGGISIKDVEKIVFEKILSYQTEIEERITQYESNDFTDRNKELEDQKALYENQMATLMKEFRIIRNEEKEYKMDGIEDKALEEEIANDKKKNQEARLLLQLKIDELAERLSKIPSADQEIAKLNKSLGIIEQLEKRNDLTITQVNALLKQVIFKIWYKRELPDNYKSLPQKEKDKIKAEITIEYI